LSRPTSEQEVNARFRRRTDAVFQNAPHDTDTPDNPPTADGRHAVTAKPIAPLAPAANPKVFTDSARVDKWFRRNCKDVLSRECSPQEKADVLAYLTRLPADKP
jgi:hypothetical protein